MLHTPAPSYARMLTQAFIAFCRYGDAKQEVQGKKPPPPNLV